MLVDTMLTKVRTITRFNFVITERVHTILSMESGKREGNEGTPLKLLVVGNNPIELGRVLEQVQKIESTKQVEIAFDYQSTIDRLANFKPEFIIIDDNIGRPELRQLVDALLSQRRTRNIHVTVLKNSNYREAITSGVMDYILKENLSSDSIYKAIRNSLKIRKTQLYLYNSYKKRKGQLARLFRPSEPAFQI